MLLQPIKTVLEELLGTTYTTNDLLLVLIAIGLFCLLALIFGGKRK